MEWIDSEGQSQVRKKPILKIDDDNLEIYFLKKILKKEKNWIWGNILYIKSYLENIEFLTQIVKFEVQLWYFVEKSMDCSSRVFNIYLLRHLYFVELK